jgi:hypothetical protein
MWSKLEAMLPLKLVVKGALIEGLSPMGRVVSMGL